ncbi:acyl-CoA dehydrogenase family protein [Actinophytocola gossypii]|uniref:acyl-CoA dehydrogenase family protein n=1 Tax=Actinophytocola gossypii TaxID=2812003 RepID=UPI0021A50199|nr:acyl-CoA dehydrogenase family protein [Actinophytocola gossypii]
MDSDIRRSRRADWLTDDLVPVRELARTFCEKELAPNLDRWRQQHHVDRELWTKAGEVGLLCLSIPEEYGGGGGSYAHDVVLLEEQTRVGDNAGNIAVHNVVAAHYLLAHGTQEQKTAWLPRMASGEVVAAIAMTEPGTGSDLRAVRTRAVRDGDEYVINGAKTFISNGALADLVIVVARTGAGTGGSENISLVLVEAERAGFRRGRVLDKIGQNAQDTSELAFEDVRVPVTNLLGTTEGQGFQQLMRQLPRERLTIAVTAAVAIETALEHTVRYTRSRSAFGRPVFDFQNTRFRLAEVATVARVVRTFVDDCVDRHLRGELDAPTAAMAKWWTTDRAMDAIDECLQLHGGYGYMTEYPIARLWADQRVQKIYGGTNEIMKEVISRVL